MHAWLEPPPRRRKAAAEAAAAVPSTYGCQSQMEEEAEEAERTDGRTAS